MRHDYETLCNHCNWGRQVSDLSLDLRRVPQHKDMSETIAWVEWVVSSKFVRTFTGHKLTGAEFLPIVEFKNPTKRSKDWYQLRVTGKVGELAESTRLGRDPFSPVANQLAMSAWALGGNGVSVRNLPAKECMGRFRRCCYECSLWAGSESSQTDAADHHFAAYVPGAARRVLRVSPWRLPTWFDCPDPDRWNTNYRFYYHWTCCRIWW